MRKRDVTRIVWIWETNTKREGKAGRPGSSGRPSCVNCVWLRDNFLRGTQNAAPGIVRQLLCVNGKSCLESSHKPGSE